MERIFNRAPINLEKAFKFDHLEKDVQKHLKNVYSTLVIGIIASVAGAYAHVFHIFQTGLLSFFLSFGLLFAILFTEHKRENVLMRLGFFTGFGFVTGMNLGPLISAVSSIDPSILPTALIATALIFISFTLSALFNRSRSYLYMGGILLSALNILTVMSLFNMFVGSKVVMSTELYLGLIVFCLFVLFDTQLIVEKRRSGDTDFIWHSLDLFVDIISIFRRIMMILGKRNERRED